MTARSETDEFGRRLYGDEDRSIVEKVADIATKRGVTRAQVALAWMLSKAVIPAPIVGITKLLQLDDAVKAVEVELTPEEIEELEKPYEPHVVAGH